MTKALVETINLSKHYRLSHSSEIEKQAVIKAVDSISISVNRGETLALVGESGSGKTTAGRTILKLMNPSSGRIFFDGTDITDLSGERLRVLRRKMQMVFQDPLTALNPAIKIGAAISEGLLAHGLAKGREADMRSKELLEEVGLRAEYYDRWPHEFSGGQRQRIGIARALAVEPSFIVCDEPVSALDVSTQAQVVNLLLDLQQAHKIAYLFIAHDLAVVSHVADRVAVMYLGRIVELASRKSIFTSPAMPYTQALLSAVPVPKPGSVQKRILLSGDHPSPLQPPSGCVFHPRCQHPAKDEACSTIVPVFEEKSPAHWVACHKVKTELPLVQPSSVP